MLLHKGRSAVERAVEAEAEDLADRAKGNAPVDTGTLSGGIEAQVSGMSATVATTSETHPGQAYYEEVGSIHNAAQQYMEHAAQESVASFPAKVAAEARAEF